MNQVGFPLLLNAGMLGTSLAAPQYQYAGYDPKSKCGNHHLEKYDNMKIEKEWYEDWAIASGFQCNSNNDKECQITKQYSYSKATSFSIGGQIQVKAKLSSVWEVAPTFSVGYSWTTTQGEATSGMQPCARGDGIQCMLMYRGKMVKIVGDYYEVPDKLYGDCGDKKSNEKPFEITSPAVVKDKQEPGNQNNDEAIVEWEACISRCDNEDACYKAFKAGNPTCPDFKKPDYWGKEPKKDEPKKDDPKKDDPKKDDPKKDDPKKDDPKKDDPKKDDPSTYDPKKDKKCEEVKQLKGQCKPEEDGKWNCFKGESYQRCSSGAWSTVTPLPAGTTCKCGIKNRSWDPANPHTNDSQ